ncbi:MAG TPA: NUDIX domain-containing protein [Nitrospirales bacterium]|nr:NUDIX domain-containing protein [Nitrospirales bacterium]
MGKVLIEKKNWILDDFFKVKEVHLRYERFDGQMSPLVRRLTFERGDSVAVLLFNPKRQHLLLVNQFKYPTYEKGPGWITETVAGMIEKNESPESAACREVEEETGYKVLKLEHISTFYVSPGGSSERIILYYAEVDENNKIEAGDGVASEDEDIMPVELSLTDAFKQIQSGEIADAKTIVGIFWLHRRLSQDLAPSATSST